MKTLVLLHGAPGDGSLWQPVVEALKTRRRVLTPTLRWFGPDAWDDGDDGRDFGTLAHAAQLVALLESCADQPVAVAAWSYSTHVVLQVLLQRPDLVERVFLYEPGLHTYLRRADDLAAFTQDAAAAFPPLVEALRRHGAAAAVEALFDMSGGPGSFAGLDPARRQIYLRSADIMTLLLGGGQPPADITADDLGRVRVPVTVAHGALTRPLFRLASRAVADAVPAARLIEVAAAGHLLPETDPAAFAALLDQWLAEGEAIDEIGAHYRNLLARHYTWMAGKPFDSRVAEERALLLGLGAASAGAGELAVDLGCGSGYQALALAELGYSVLALDLSAELLDELRSRAGIAPVTPVLADIRDVAAHVPAGQAAVVCCMGDTLTHLPDRRDVVRLLTDAATLLRPGGLLVLSYRDLSASSPHGNGRFFPVASDPDRILTCMVEPEDDGRARITDLLHQRQADGTWTLQVSSYGKLRLPAAWVTEQMAALGFDPIVRQPGRLEVIAARRRL